MDEQKQRMAKRINVGKILLWLGLLIFFFYSYQIIIDLTPLTHPRRQESFIRIITALGNPNIFDREIGRQVAMDLWETIQIAFLATTMSAILALPFTFLRARAPSRWQRGLNILLQLMSAIVRAVHPLWIVVPMVVLAGIGATAGVLALTLFSTGVLISKFSEFAQQHPSLGGPALIQVYFPGLTFKHLPINIVIASILGIYGGGGIGFSLQEHLNLLNYRQAGVALLAMISVTGSLDLLSRAVWSKILSSEHTSPLGTE